MKRVKRRHHRSGDKDGTDMVLDQELDGEPQIGFFSLGADDDESQPHWHVLLELASNPAIRSGVNVRGEVIRGRGHDLPNLIDLIPYGAQDCRLAGNRRAANTGLRIRQNMLFGKEIYATITS